MTRRIEEKKRHTCRRNNPPLYLNSMPENSKPESKYEYATWTLDLKLWMTRLTLLIPLPHVRVRRFPPPFRRPLLRNKPPPSTATLHPSPSHHNHFNLQPSITGQRQKVFPGKVKCSPIHLSIDWLTRPPLGISPGNSSISKVYSYIKIEEWPKITFTQWTPSDMSYSETKT